MSIRLLAACLVSLASSGVLAHDYKAGSVRIDHPFAMPTPPGAQVGGVWLKTLVNSGAQPDRLVRASTPVAGRVEIHTLSTEGGVARMRELDSLALAPGQRIEMRPQAGEHLMLAQLKQPLKEGEHFPLTLEFERGGKVEVKVYVQTPKGRGAAAAATHQH